MRSVWKKVNHKEGPTGICPVGLGMVGLGSGLAARDGLVFYDVIRGYYPSETNGQLQKPEVQLKRLK